MLGLVVLSFVMLNPIGRSLVMLGLVVLDFVTLYLVMSSLVMHNFVMLSLSKHDLAVRMVAASDATLAARGCMLRQAQHDGQEVWRG
ncbi:MAG: hypothetical protein AMXMBFR61_06840 [Fimbriimonadales bacterium]